MTVKLGYCIHCGQANITCINTQKDGTMTHYSIAKQGECGPLIIDDVEIPEPNWKARTPPPAEPGLREAVRKEIDGLMDNARHDCATNRAVAVDRIIAALRGSGEG